MSRTRQTTLELTPYELQVLQLAAVGDSIKAAAAKLDKSEQSIEKARRRVRHKLGATMMLEAVTFAREKGIIK
jgi:DNA-binding NarL/FixJ family response regulator